MLKVKIATKTPTDTSRFHRKASVVAGYEI